MKNLFILSVLFLSAQSFSQTYEYNLKCRTLTLYDYVGMETIKKKNLNIKLPNLDRSKQEILKPTHGQTSVRFRHYPGASSVSIQFLKDITRFKTGSMKGAIKSANYSTQGSFELVDGGEIRLNAQSQFGKLSVSCIVEKY